MSPCGISLTHKSASCFANFLIPFSSSFYAVDLSFIVSFIVLLYALQAAISATVLSFRLIICSLLVYNWLGGHCVPAVQYSKAQPIFLDLKLQIADLQSANLPPLVLEKVDKISPIGSDSISFLDFSSP